MKKSIRSQSKNKNSTPEQSFRNSDQYLSSMVPKILEERKQLGLSGLVGGLDSIIINTEPQHQWDAVKELLTHTGYHFSQAFQESSQRTIVLSQKNSADLFIKSHTTPNDLFTKYNEFPKSRHLPNTRLETFIFAVKNIQKYVDIQQEQGVTFLTSDIVHTPHYSFVQTPPSHFTGNSIGFIQWHQKKRDYTQPNMIPIAPQTNKPDYPHLKNITCIDHAATRVHAKDRDNAILEFMRFTNYCFQFAVYIEEYNSITNVARLTEKDFAMVFTSGIQPYISDQLSGPTEKFIHNYGPRVHHLAYKTNHIENTFQDLKDKGLEFLIELVGSPKEGLKQTFSYPSPHTLLVNEYIYRYGDFDGFFTKGNVTLLTGSTSKQ
jgi:4-hydroxyphenylpyruvate dioxygenase-like putative hemolysin